MYQREEEGRVKGFAKKSILAVLAFAAIAGAYAQKGTSSQSTTIQIVAVVPTVLRLSLDFSQNGTTQVVGFIPGAETLRSNVSYSKNSSSRFEIKSGVSFELGNAQIFSNLPSSYSIIVYSANGGTLRDASGDANGAIPYQLCLGAAISSARGGMFSFVASGKSSKYNAPLKVAISIPSVPPTAASGFYTDQLMFSVSAN